MKENMLKIAHAMQMCCVICPSKKNPKAYNIKAFITYTLLFYELLTFLLALAQLIIQTMYCPAHFQTPF